MPKILNRISFATIAVLTAFITLAVYSDDIVGIRRYDAGTNEVIGVEMPFDAISAGPSAFISGDFWGDGSMFSDRLYLCSQDGAGTIDKTSDLNELDEVQLNYAFLSDGIWLDSSTLSRSTMTPTAGDTLYLLRADTEPFSFFLHGRYPFSPYYTFPIPRFSQISVSHGVASIRFDTDRPVDIFQSNNNKINCLNWSYIGRFPYSQEIQFETEASTNATSYFLVSDATLDTDADAISDALEKYVYGTSANLADTDFDGIPDALEIAWNRNPLLADEISQMLFCETFEPPQVTIGSLDGQNSWNATHNALVQDAISDSGSSSLLICAHSNETGFASHAINASTNKTVWIDCRVSHEDFANAELPSVSPFVLAFVFDTFGHPVMTDGFTIVTNTAFVCDTKEYFHRVTMHLDFNLRSWNLYIDGILAGENLSMRGENPALNEIFFEGDYGFADDIKVTIARPEGLSSDFDKMSDEWEMSNFGSLSRDGKGDFDSDGLLDEEEYIYGTDPKHKDTDLDAIPDSWEVLQSLNPLDSSDAAADFDNDGLTNLQEYHYDSNPFMSENSLFLLKEGFRDGINVSYYKSDSALTTLPDVSKLDFIESKIVTNVNENAATNALGNAPSYLTDNFVAIYSGYIYIPTAGTVTFTLASDDGSRLTIDSQTLIDNNGTHTKLSKKATKSFIPGLYPFSLEYFNASSTAELMLSWKLPNGEETQIPAENYYILKYPGSENVDLDRDGMQDWWEKIQGFDSSSAADAILDSDADGLTNLEEFSIRSNPYAVDSDGDTLTDKEEVSLGSSPIKIDTDNDGLPDALELRYGWDPNWPGETDPANAPNGPFTTFTHYADGTKASVDAKLRNAINKEAIAKFTVKVDISSPDPHDMTVYGLSSPGGIATLDDMITRDLCRNYTTANTNNFIYVKTLNPKPAFCPDKTGILMIKLKCDDHAKVTIGNITVENAWPNEEYALAWGIVEANTVNPVDITWDSNKGGCWNLDYECYFYPEKPRPHVDCNPWIGLDRTGDPREPYVSSNVVATAFFTPSNPAPDSVTWQYSGICEQRTETPLSLTLWTTNRESASASYRDQKITARIPGGHYATNNFTVVKVDVTIGDVIDELEEATTGAFVPFIPDGTNEQEHIEWTNNLVDVSFSCKPTNLPSEEMLAISNMGLGELYEQLEDGTFVLITKANYPACEIAKRRFKLHGHNASTNFMGEAISVIHVSSGARDDASYTVLDRPRLVPDYDRDGNINDQDESIYNSGRPLRFWINDDEDDDSTDGKYAESPLVDIPGAETGLFEFDERDPDWADSEVNGYRDLIDFTPVFMDMSAIQILPEKIRNDLKFKLRHDSKAVKVVWTAMSKFSAGSFQKGVVNNCGRNLNESSYEAETEEVKSSGINVPDTFVALMRTASTDKGVVFIEGCKAADTPLKLDIYYNDQKVVTGELPLHFSSVEEMYWFYSIRGAESNPTAPIPNSNSPDNLMENPADIDIFFMHGFNVDSEAARGWGSEVFKRLWQSGSNARFHMVTWAGDYRFGEDMNPFEFMNGFFYHRDVQYALNSADAYKRLVKSVQANKSKRVLMAQSLGNMVTCEAIRLGLDAEKYYMFNAAVASEAIVSTLQNVNDTIRQKFVPPDWRSYNSLSWAANWFRLFPNDDRSHIGWPGYFSSELSGISEVCNYYSSGDPVLVSNADVPSALTKTLYVQWPVSFSWSWPFIRFQSFEFQATFERFAWQKQEVLKGVNPYLATREGGWGFHSWPVDLPNGETEWRTFTAQEAQEMVTNGSIVTNAVFERSVKAMFSPTIPLAERNRILAYNVPAVSESTGSVPTFESQSKFVNLNSSAYKNGWGRLGNPYNDQWLHSDMKDMAYYYVFRLYDELVQKIQGGAQ